MAFSSVVFPQVGDEEARKDFRNSTAGMATNHIDLVYRGDNAESECSNRYCG